MKRLRKRDKDDEDNEEEIGSRTIFIKRGVIPTKSKTNQHTNQSKRSFSTLITSASSDGVDNEEDIIISDDISSSSRQRKVSSAFVIPSDIKSKLTTLSYTGPGNRLENDRTTTQAISEYSTEGLRLLRAQQSWLDRPLGEEENDTVTSTIDKIGNVFNNGNKIKDLNELDAEMMGEEAEAILYQAGVKKDNENQQSVMSQTRKGTILKDILSKESRRDNDRTLTPPPEAPPGTLRSTNSSYSNSEIGHSSTRVELVNPDKALDFLMERIETMANNAEATVNTLHEEVLSLKTQQDLVHKQLNDLKTFIHEDASCRFDFYRKTMTLTAKALEVISFIQEKFSIDQLISTSSSYTEKSELDIHSIENKIRSTLHGDHKSTEEKERLKMEIDEFLKKFSIENIAQIKVQVVEQLKSWNGHSIQKINSSYPIKCEVIIELIEAFVNVIEGHANEMDTST
jgi:hypothetical protein